MNELYLFSFIFTEIITSSMSCRDSMLCYVLHHVLIIIIYLHDNCSNITRHIMYLKKQMNLLFLK